jgi:hypothetical protein
MRLAASKWDGYDGDDGYVTVPKPASVRTRLQARIFARNRAVDGYR